MTKFTKQHHSKVPDHHSRIFVYQKDKETEDINEYEFERMLNQYSLAAEVFHEAED